MIEIETIKSVVRDCFSGIPSVFAVYLHGSMIKGAFRPESDIDIGIMLPNGKMDKFRLLEISSELELKLNRTVDIGIISSENLIYSKEAIINGKCIFCNNELEKSLKEATLLSLYQDFCFERREIVNAYRN